ncbi:MAG: 2-oxoglutarate and iron-dependent oxygenase domain-containing protein [Pseudomonadota bacterium]
MSGVSHSGATEAGIEESGVILEAGLQGQRVSVDEIPVVDMSAFTDPGSRDPVALHKMVQDLDFACRNVGFFYVKNHGVSAEQMSAIFDVARGFFAREEAEKNALHIKNSPYHRGYFPYFEENTDPTMTADLKEGFDIGREVPVTDPDVVAGKPLHGPNQWPDDDGTFRSVCDSYFAAMNGLAHRILRGMALALELDEDYFVDRTQKPLAQLRLLHYPPQAGTVVERTLGCGAHSDYGTLTILLQDSVGGLQLQNANGEWIEAPPIPGTFIINVGEQMARWTNDRFPATLHRVINRSGKERYSVPFFFDPDYDTMVETLPSCLEPGEPVRYPPISSGDHLMSRLSETFSYLGAENKDQN